MSSHNICFHGEIRKISVLFVDLFDAFFNQISSHLLTTDLE